MIHLLMALHLISQSMAFADPKPKDEVSFSHRQGKISLSEVPHLLDTLKNSSGTSEVLILADTNTNPVAAQINDSVGLANLTPVRVNIENDVFALAKQEHPEHLTGLRTWWKQKYVRPLAIDVYWGIIMGGFRGTTASVIWFSSGLDPVTASTLVVGQAVLDFVNQTFSRTIDNIVGGQEDTQTSFREMSYRLLYSAFFTYLWRGISGPVNAAASVTTVQGNIEVLSNIFSKSLSGVYFGAKKRLLSQFAAGLIGFQVYMLGSLITSLDLAGITLQSWTVRVPLIDFDLVVKSSTLAIVIFYTSMGLAVKYFPNSFERLAKFFGNMGGKVRSAFANRCGSFF